MDSEKKELFERDDDLMALAGIGAPAPGLHSEFDMEAARNTQVNTALFNFDSLEMTPAPEPKSAEESCIAPRSAHFEAIRSDKKSSAKFDAIRSERKKAESAPKTQVKDATESAHSSAKTSVARATAAGLIESLQRLDADSEQRPAAEQQARETAEQAPAEPSPVQDETPAQLPEKPSAPEQPNAVTASEQTATKAAVENTTADTAADVMGSEDLPKQVAEDTKAPTTVVPSQTAVADEKEELEDAFWEPQILSRKSFSVTMKNKGREFSQALMSIAGTPQRSGRFWLTVIAMLIVISMTVILAHYKHREIQLGYMLTSAISDREALLEENRMLRVELRVMSSRERLEPLANRQLGLSKITPEQIIFINHTPIKKEPPASPEKRNDGLDNVKILEN